ncbi:hypothetical protein MVES_002925 [Malassezia vespertilionis]|uniref:ER membrane protein complex subunit 2 n=1 Tax=Malassezia vespertilionis TaxID=2020962 RepID=A0A2N1J9J6_9BASI|nr:hypothetical protein MVES_002925 [Malassezia vespertilionis]
MSTEPITLDRALEWLAEQRILQERKPYDVVRMGEWILEQNQLGALGDDLWAFLEQVALAAAELGNYELAELCLSRLTARFPDSARVVLLQGTILEAKGLLQEARTLYTDYLGKDPSNILIHKRLIAAIRSGPDGLAEATAELAEFVDTFPLDQESWLELASLYMQQNKYAQAVYALEELLLIAPHNAFYLLEYAEVLYTAGDIGKAYKIYLRILELSDGILAPEKYRAAGKIRGPWVRALWGLKMSIVQIRAEHAPKRPASDALDIVPEKVDAVDTLVTKLLLDSIYAPNVPDATPIDVRAAVRSILAAS